ncbi:MAG: class I SAM-dependent methyltransferase [Candidatus Paceibacterota bacterium]|jgi:ubiquinone/menaquinone biosynthesis C-methylase UbiE
MNIETAKNILNDNKNTWNNIAEKFELTRHRVWDLEPLADYAKSGMKTLDLGCGNGRLYEILKNKEIEYTGVDISENLINIARAKYPKIEFLVGDGIELPFRDYSFDIVYSVAVFHHLPSKTLRVQFLKEVKRVLKKDGKIILIVWNLWQRKYFKLLVKSSLLKVLHKSKLDWGDLYIPWQNQYQRYHHAFTKKELKKLFIKAGLSIEKSKSQKRNILIIGKNI